MTSVYDDQACRPSPHGAIARNLPDAAGANHSISLQAPEPIEPWLVTRTGATESVFLQPRGKTEKKEQNMADGRESQYMTPRGNIIQSPRTAGNLSAALGSLEAMWFCLALGIGVGGLLQSARHYRNKIQTGKQGSRLGCCWHLTN